MGPQWRLLRKYIQSAGRAMWAWNCGYVLTYRRQQFHSVKSIEMISLSEWRLGVPNLHHSLDVSRHPLDRADSVLRVVCTARGLRGDGKWGLVNTGARPFRLGRHQTVEHRPGRRQGQQKPWLESQGGLPSGSVDGGCLGSSLHSTVPVSWLWNSRPELPTQHFSLSQKCPPLF